MAHETYNIRNYPVFVCHHGNWDIYRNANGYCAAIPAPDAPKGCLATHFGDSKYVRSTLGINLDCVA